MKKSDIKYIVIICISLAILGLNGIVIKRIYDKRQAQKNQTVYMKVAIDQSEYYNREFIGFSAAGKDGYIQFPRKKNTLLIGLYRQPKEILQAIERHFRGFDFKKFDVDIAVLTEDPSLSGNIFSIYTFDNSPVARYLGASGKMGDFTILIDAGNMIQYIETDIIAASKLEVLIRRFEIE
ncbi:hypothetical protein ACFL6L_04110 [candidate division KSB1 bacterium]